MVEPKPSSLARASADASAGDRIRVEIVFALPERSVGGQLELPPGATAGDALLAAEGVPGWPAADIDPERLGIFSRRVTTEHRLHDGDRLECYRPLRADPKDARRKRAQRRA